MTEYDDPELERLVRASLDTHAGEVDTAVPVAARARTAARPHRGRWIALGAAAAVAAAVAAVAVPVLVIDRHEQTNTVQPATALPTQWRTEYWHDISVEVPVEWEWGAAPLRQGDDVLRCGGPSPGTPYVGRPIYLSDACMSGIPTEPVAPYVWLDAPVEPGTVDVGNGYTQETVEIGGTTVTVGTDDPALREQILASATVGGPCAPGLSAPPVVAVTEDGALEEADSLLVCAYRAEDNGSYSLVYADELDAAAAAATEDLVRSAPVITGDCLSPEGGEWVTLSARGDSGWSREYVVDLNCPAVTDSLGQMHRLIPAMVRPWAVNGLPSTLYGPSGGKGATFDSFIGMLG